DRMRDLPDCEFLMGPAIATEITDATVLASEQGYPNFIPIRIGANESLACTNSPVAVELRLGDRWDAVEAQALAGVANLAMSIADFLSAHDLSLSLDIYQLPLLLDIDLDQWIECTTSRNWEGQTALEGIDCDGDGQLSLQEECIEQSL